MHPCKEQLHVSCKCFTNNIAETQRSVGDSTVCFYVACKQGGHWKQKFALGHSRVRFALPSKQKIGEHSRQKAAGRKHNYSRSLAGRSSGNSYVGQMFNMKQFDKNNPNLSLFLYFDNA